MFSTVNRKLMLTYLFYILIILFVIIGQTLILSFNNRAIDSLMEENFKSINALDLMIDAIERQDSAVLLIISGNTEEGTAQYNQNTVAFLDAFADEKNNITEQGEQELTEAVAKKYESYLSTFLYLGQYLNYDEKYPYYSETIYPLFWQIEGNIKQLRHINETAMLDKKQALVEHGRLVIFCIILGAALLIAVSVLFSGRFVRYVLQPLKELTSGIRDVTNGVVGKKIEIRSKDEIGYLAHEFNNMTVRLWEYDRSSVGQLMAERNRTLGIIKSIGDPLFVIDMDMRISMANKTAEGMFGMALVGHHIFEILHDYELVEYLQSGKYFTKGKILEFVKDFKTYYFGLSPAMVKDEEGNTVEYVLVLQDITNTKELEHARNDFITMLSHEFKTPLTSIMMGANLLSEGNERQLGGEQRELVETLCDDSLRLSKLLGELFEMMRMDSGQVEYVFEPFSIYAIAEISVSECSRYAEINSISIKNSVSSSLPFIQCDPKRLKWVINNLLTNAVKNTPEDGDVVISAILDDKLIKVTVSDEGCGIPPENLERIFEKYVYLGEEYGEIQRTGLGLFLCREIITAHGGTIWAESSQKGSKFIFTVPVREEKE